jgi:hypothetical protein
MQLGRQVGRLSSLQTADGCCPRIRRCATRIRCSCVRLSVCLSEQDEELGAGKLDFIRVRGYEEVLGLVDQGYAYAQRQASAGVLDRHFGGVRRGAAADGVVGTVRRVFVCRRCARPCEAGIGHLVPVWHAE